jgi:hypothetical protein
MKRCSRCKQSKVKAEFSKSVRSNDGLDNYCKSCRSEYYLERRSLKLEPREKNQCRRCWIVYDDEQFKSYCKSCRRALGSAHNLKRYGLTVDDYIRMEQERGAMCDACGKPETERARLSIDHDHSCCPGNESCGKCIRGLLCFRCNTALGLIKDDPETLKKMLEYIKNF